MSIFADYIAEVEEASRPGAPLLVVVEPGFPWEGHLAVPQRGRHVSAGAAVSVVREVVQAAARGHLSEVWFGLEGVNATAQNALLKFLEEGAYGCRVFLVAYPSTDVLPTVISRCFTHHLSPPSEEVIAFVLGSHADRLPAGFSGTLADAKAVTAGDAGRVTEVLRSLQLGERVGAIRATMGTTRDDAALLGHILRRHVVGLEPRPELGALPASALAAWSRVLTQEPTPLGIRTGVAAVLAS